MQPRNSKQYRICLVRTTASDGQNGLQRGWLAIGIPSAESWRIRAGSPCESRPLNPTADHCAFRIAAFPAASRTNRVHAASYSRRGGDTQSGVLLGRLRLALSMAFSAAVAAAASSAAPYRYGIAWSSAVSAVAGSAYFMDHQYGAFELADAAGRETAQYRSGRSP